MKSSDQDFRVGKLIRPKNPKSWEKAMTDKRLQEILFVSFKAERKLIITLTRVLFRTTAVRLKVK